MGITLLDYNFKGGCGKTSMTMAQGYIDQQEGKKVLLVDLDPQANLTELTSRTYHKDIDPSVDMYDGFKKWDFSNSIVHVVDGLDIIPSNWKMNDLVTNLAKFGRGYRKTILKRLLAPFKPKYDYILLDVPPTLNDLVINALYAADFVSLVIQTQQLSYSSAIKTVNQFLEMKKHDHATFHMLGVVLYLLSKTKDDQRIVHEAKKVFGSFIYKHAVKFQERIKGFTSTGFKQHDYWDKRAVKNYKEVNDDILNRIKKVMTENE